MESKSDKGFLYFDVAVVSIWIFFATWYSNGFSLGTLGWILPVAVARLMISFGLYYRVEKIFWIVTAYTVSIAITLLFDADIVLDIFAVPFMKFVRCIWDFTAQESGYTQPMFISHFLRGCDPGPCPKVIFALGPILFVFFCFLPLFQALWFRFIDKDNDTVRLDWPWLKIALCFFLYGLCAAAIILSAIGLNAQYSLYPKLLLSAVLVCFLLYFRYKGLLLTRVEKDYLLIMLSIGIASEGGFHTNLWLSIIVMLFSTVLVIWYFSRKYAHLHSRTFYKLVSLVLAANILMLSMGYMTQTLKSFALIIILGCAVGAVLLYKRENHSLSRSIALTILATGILPILSLGYNPTACWQATIVGNIPAKQCKYTGLFLVKSKYGVGLRDRYGYIILPRFKSIECMQNRTSLFLIENNDNKFGVYDLADNELVAKCKYSSIKPYSNSKGENQWVWELSTFQDGKEVVEYLKRERGKYIVSNEPIRHLLSHKEFPADYNLSPIIENPEVIDSLLAFTLNSLQNRPYGEPEAEYHWQWAKQLRQRIDSLAEEGKISEGELGRHQEVVRQLMVYTRQDPKGDSDPALNAELLMYSIAHYYHMLYYYQLLDERLENVDLQKEFKYFYDYISFLLKTNLNISNIPGLYYDVDGPNGNLLGSIWINHAHNQRRMLDVMDGKETITEEAERPSVETIRKHYHQRMLLDSIPPKQNWELEPYNRSDTIGMYLIRWTSYRDSIAEQMPEQYAKSFRNQTTNIILKETDLLIHDLP